MNESTAASVTSKSIASAKWAVMMEIVSRAISPVTFVVLARILSPQDYGIVAVAQVVISFCSLFWDAGLQKALIQTREPLNDAANVVFWINVALGLILYFGMFIAAPALATFLNCADSYIVLRVLGLQIIIGSFSTAQQGLFLREMNFKNLFYARLASALIPFFVSIPLALYGFGVWALVASSLVASGANLGILWLGSCWRPHWGFNYTIARKMAGFGLWIVGDSFIGWIISQGDAVFVSRYLGVRDLGLYRTGRNVVDMLFGLALNPINPILYPAFSALKDNREELKAYLFRANRLLMMLSLPIGAGLMCIAKPLAGVLLGEKWQGVEVVIGIVAIQNSLSWLVGANPEVYRAIGRPDVQTKIGIISIPLYLVVYFIAAPMGLEAFVLGRLSLTVVSMFIHIWWAHKILQLPFSYIWSTGRSVILSTLFMVLFIQFVKLGICNVAVLYNDFLVLPVIILSGIVSYVISLWVFDRPMVFQALNLLKRVIRK